MATQRLWAVDKMTGNPVQAFEPGDADIVTVADGLKNEVSAMKVLLRVVADDRLTAAVDALEMEYGAAAEQAPAPGR